mmetsp:Transcript_26604/g.68559  ORF Transcript_26604/g.68559 Transcript_26604/m.68559 type:complete len:83 (+) Transcript_26604:642-890(+)
MWHLCCAPIKHDMGCTRDIHDTEHTLFTNQRVLPVEDELSSCRQFEAIQGGTDGPPLPKATPHHPKRSKGAQTVGPSSKQMT